MTGSGRRPIVNAALWIVAPIVLLAIVRPWTIRPIDDNKPTIFEPGTFAATAWPRLQREASETAADVADIAPPAGVPATRPRFVKGTGVVTAVDRQSRVGIVRLQLAGSKPGTVAIQIGPVIRGTALRDATSFIQFSDFKNQFDYAGAANALNDYALRTVVAPVDFGALQGRTLTFTGALGKSALREDGAIEIVPVQLEIREAAK